MAEIRLEVIDRAGWRQAVTLAKALSYVGSDPRCDLILDNGRGRGVAARHLQLIAVPGQPGVRVVNVGEAVTVLTRTGERTLAPRALADVAEGDQIRIGEFTLAVVNAGVSVDPNGRASTSAAANPGAGAGWGAAAGAAAAAAVVAAPDRPASAANGTGHGGRGIALEVRLPEETLTPERPLEGAVVIRNMGDRAGAQFRIEVQGLSAECYEIGSGPILFPNAQKEVLFRLRHPRNPSLLAGRQRFRVTVTAPEAYPGEAAAASCAVMVQPYYAHRVTVTPLE